MFFSCIIMALKLTPTKLQGMNKIVEKEFFSESVVKLVIHAPHIARSRKAGHFVIVRTGHKGERIPLTIAAADARKGTITLIIQQVGVTSAKLCKLQVGDVITDVVGPLGKPTHIENIGTVLASGGGVGVAPLAAHCGSFQTGREPGHHSIGCQEKRADHFGRTNETALR
jgi:NAD(P)H-flavin reductase